MSPRNGPKSFKALALATVALTLLAACGGQPKSAEAYRLTAVLPSSLTPGETVVVYGVFPAEATLTLDGSPVASTPVPSGLQTVLPETTIAGEHGLEVGSGLKLTGKVQVVPRIDTVTLQGRQLTVTGAGWPAAPTPEAETRLEIGGFPVAPQQSAGRLQADLDAALPYGPLEVRVVVGDQVSKGYPLVLEAGAVTGRVTFPAASSAPGLSLQDTGAQLETLPALVVFHTSAWTGLSDASVRSAEEVAALGATRLLFEDVESAQQAVGMLVDTPGVTSVEWDAPVQTDGFESLAATLPGSPGEGQWALSLIGIREAWAVTKGEGITVAVLDTGVDLNHPDLQANLLPGYDFVDNDADPSDRAGHGTHVAGLVAANGRVLGTAPSANILPVRVLEGDAGGSAFTVAQGLLWAAGLLKEPPNPHPAQVVSLSLGTSSTSSVLTEAVGRVLAAGVVIVAATGNSGGSPTYPAALPGVVSVTALAGPVTAYQPWYANRGPGTYLTAYGGDTTQDQNRDKMPDGILSTDLSKDGQPGYGLRMGTSMASPQVAGLVALALASGTPATIARDTLAGTAVDLGPQGYDPSFGYGLATGRTATGSDPRSYVVAFDAAGEVMGWTLVQADTTYTLSDLPPGIPLTLRALSDEDGDLVLGEAGELVSAPVTFTASAGETSFTPDTSLTLSNGAWQLVLTARR